MKEKFGTITIDFQSLFETGRNLFIAISPDLKIIGASEAFLETTNSKRHKIMGQSLFEAFPFYNNAVIPDEDELSIASSLQYVLQNKEAHTILGQQIDLPKRRNSHETRFWNIHNIPVLFEQQQLLCIIHKIEDVTEFELVKKDAEVQLKRKIELEAAEKMHLQRIKESEARFLKIFNLSPVPIFVIEASNNKLALVNQAFEQFLHLKSENILGKTAFDLSIVDKSNHDDLIRQLSAKGGITNDIEFTISTAAKETKKMLASSELVEIEDKKCYLIVMIDITLRKQFESNLLQSNHFLDTILENIPDMVFVKKADDLSYLRLNKAGEDLLGISQQNIIGKTHFDFFPKEMAESKSSKEKELFIKGNISEVEEEPFKTKNGIKWISTKKIPVYENGKPTYLVGISEDITDRKKQQDAILQLNKELEAFSYSVSHDLRAPLRAVTGYAQILDEDYSNVLDSEGKRLLHTISDNAEKMGQLIDNLLKFSRLGRKELLKRETNMNDLVHNAIAEINKSTEHNAGIVVNELNNVKSDPELMTQVVINLLENAIKYSSKKEKPQIEISSKISGNDVVFSIKDNGAGFDMRYYDKLFGVFQRLHTVDEFDGTGVGLAIVQRIINKHGGKAWAEGIVNEGATFYFSVPAK